MATPSVAGLIALMLEANPALSHRKLKEILKQTVTTWGHEAPFTYPSPDRLSK